MQVLLGLGDFRFSMLSAAYDTLRRSTEWRWAKVDRINRMPALQYIGPGAESITLSGTIYPHMGAGLSQIAAMRAAAGAGTPLPLVSGRGDVIGRWCISRVEETVGAMFADGAARKQDFSLTLDAYGEDGASGSEAVVPRPSVAASGAAPAALAGVSGVGLSAALAAVEPIAREVEAVGMAVVDAATTVVAMADRVAAVATGLITDLEAVVVAPVLDLVGRPTAVLAAAVADDALRAVGGVVGAINATAEAFRDEAAGVLFGARLAGDAIRVCRAVDAAAERGVSWP